MLLRATFRKFLESRDLDFDPGCWTRLHWRTSHWPLATYQVSSALLNPCSRIWTLHLADSGKKPKFSVTWLRPWDEIINSALSVLRRYCGLMISKLPFVSPILSWPIDLAWGHISKLSAHVALTLTLNLGKILPSCITHPPLPTHHDSWRSDGKIRTDRHGVRFYNVIYLWKWLKNETYHLSSACICLWHREIPINTSIGSRHVCRWDHAEWTMLIGMCICSLWFSHSFASYYVLALLSMRQSASLVSQAASISGRQDLDHAQRAAICTPMLLLVSGSRKFYTDVSVWV